MLSWEDFDLIDDPFAVTPPKDRIVWADRKEFKEELENSIKRSLLSKSSRIIACIWGVWGAGKTHAMNYFADSAIMEELVTELGLEIRLPIVIPIIFPLRDILDTIYLEIIGQIGIERIDEALSEIDKKFPTVRSKEAFLNEVSKYVDYRVAKDLVELKGQSPLVFERYLYGTATSSELRSVGVPRGIRTGTDKTRAISSILNLLTGTLTSRIFIWFDDMERIGDAPGKETFEFQYLIRDLLDLVPTNLIIIFNLTMMPGEDVEERLSYLGDAIKYRISERIVVSAFSKAGFFQYVKDLLAKYRSKSFEEVKGDFFPFEEKALEKIFSEIKRRTIPLIPRDVNQAISSTLAIAMINLQPSNPTITSTFVQSNLGKIFSKIISRRPSSGS